MQKKIKWIILLAISTLVLFVRVIDLVSEAANEGFHITRIGINMFGMNAFVIQLGIITVSLMLSWTALRNCQNYNR